MKVLPAEFMAPYSSSMEVSFFLEELDLVIVDAAVVVDGADRDFEAGGGLGSISVLALQT